MAAERAAMKTGLLPLRPHNAPFPVPGGVVGVTGSPARTCARKERKTQKTKGTSTDTHGTRASAPRTHVAHWDLALESREAIISKEAPGTANTNKGRKENRKTTHKQGQPSGADGRAPGLKPLDRSSASTYPPPRLHWGWGCCQQAHEASRGRRGLGAPT